MAAIAIPMAWERNHNMLDRKHSRRAFLRGLGLGALSLALPNGKAAARASAAPRRPNIILILADDMGFSDIGCYGSEIRTSNLDRLAREGLRFTQFYNGARCMPTRAALLTGLYSHQAGIGHMAMDFGVPSYRGHLNDQCVTIAEALRPGGYQTMMTGKWHVGNEAKGTVPWTRGFDRYFGRTQGADYFKVTGLHLDGEPFTYPDADNFYLTTACGEYASRFIEEADREKPFFLYMGFNAPHWPLHARPEDIAKYRGKYKAGWDKVRRARHEKMVREGILEKDTPLPPRDPAVPAWEKAENKDLWDLKMSVYAAQIDSMDESIGMVMKKLRAVGEAENTLVFFLSDNGGCAEGIGRVGPKSKIPPGPGDSFMAYHMPWANVSSAPFKFYKHWTHEGGIATPLVVSWPRGIKAKGKVVGEVGHIIDIMATCLDVAGTDYPKTFNGKDITPLEGKSLAPIFKTGRREGHDALFWEHEGNRAVRQGKWKLVSRSREDHELYKSWGFPNVEPRMREWELYDLETDRLERRDLAPKRPDKVRELAALFDRWAERVGVLSWDDDLGPKFRERKTSKGKKK